MRRDRVSSSSIAAIGYDPDLHILEVEFHSGRVYQYASVPQRIHHELLAAKSIGTYFNANIRTRYADWKDVTDEQ